MVMGNEDLEKIMPLRPRVGRVLRIVAPFLLLAGASVLVWVNPDGIRRVLHGGDVANVVGNLPTDRPNVFKLYGS